MGWQVGDAPFHTQRALVAELAYPQPREAAVEGGRFWGGSPALQPQSVVQAVRNGSVQPRTSAEPGQAAP